MKTLKWQKMNCGIDEVRKLVQDSLEENISRESFDKTLRLLIDNDSVKSNSISNRVCVSIPKTTTTQTTKQKQNNNNRNNNNNNKTEQQQQKQK